MWWASATPLENGSLARAHDLDLLLNSIGPREGHHFYWDESLHGDVKSDWSYAAGPSLWILRGGLVGLGALIVFSFSRRRNGPVRGMICHGPRVRRLWSSLRRWDLYIRAPERHRQHWRWRLNDSGDRVCDCAGLRASPMSAAELAAAIRRRFPTIDDGLEADLAACEEGVYNETLDPRQSLKLIQAMHGYQARLALAARPGATQTDTNNKEPQPQERAS